MVYRHQTFDFEETPFYFKNLQLIQICILYALFASDWHRFDSIRFAFQQN